MNRRSAWLLYLALSMGVVMVLAITGLLFAMKVAPLTPASGDSFFPWVLVLVGGSALVLGLGWARPRVPTRPRDQTPDDFWATTDAGPKALTCWVLFEGAGIVGALGTMLTGSVATAALGVLAVANLVVNAPTFFESRES